MIYITIKAIHILGAIVMFGTGAGIAFFKFVTDWKGSLENKAFINRYVVLADLVFTTPSVILQPITGFWLLYLSRVPWDTSWVWQSLVLYGVAGLCWLPVVYLQIWMRNEAEEALREGRALRPAYRNISLAWALLGIPAFGAMLAIVWLMTAKPAG